MTEVIETTEVVTRKNDFCVISKTPNENGWYDIQSNSAWSANPYGDDYAEVEDELVEGAMETCGYLHPVFNAEGTKMVDYTPAEIPVFPEPEEPEPTPTDNAATWDEMAAAIEDGVNSI